MGYVEGLLGDNEQVLYRTHRHIIVLLQQVIGWIFAAAVFLAIAVIALWPLDAAKGTEVRRWIGLIALVSVVVPLVRIVSAWMKGYRGEEFLDRIVWPAVIAVFVLIVALVTIVRPEVPYVAWVALLMAAASLAELVRRCLDWTNERYIITNRRIVQVRGTVNKQVSDSALEKVNDVVLQQSIMGRTLGYGTVEIITGSDIGVNVFKRIANPVRFKRAMLNAKEQLHSIPSGLELVGSAVASPTAPAAEAGQEPPDATASIPDLIVELDDLRNKGILSEEEFQTKKQELLDRL